MSLWVNHILRTSGVATMLNLSQWERESLDEPNRELKGHENRNFLEYYDFWQTHFKYKIKFINNL